MKKILTTIAPPLLILLFVYAAVSKLADVTSFRQEMHNQNFPPEVASALVFLVPAAEVAAIILLLSRRWLIWGLSLSAALMAAFTGYIGLVLAGYWERVPCSCGGILKHLSWRAHFIFNLFFLALSAAALAQRYKGNAENLRKE